jgi:histidinol-phosphatase (PHP family)
MLFDSHLHTIFSTDSEMKFADLQAKSQQESCGIIITEHLDLNYPVPDKFTFSVGDYFTAYESYRSKRLLLGIEIGLRSDCLEKNRQVVSHHPFDFVLGSIHVVNQHDLYYAPYYEGRSKQAAYLDYFQAMIDCVKVYDFIDSLGHIDYIARYAPYSDPEVYYHEFSEAIDAVLISLAQQEVALEINTRRFAARQVIDYLIPIYHRFHELGGKYVTLGSDAHQPEAVARHLADAWELAQTCNLQAIYYEDRQRKTMKV